jgi:O-succinylbenzoate synthase
LIDFDTAPVFAIPVLDAWGGRTVREGMLLEGPQGWGEFSPPPGCDDATAARWLTAAMEPGTVGWPDPVRGRVPVAVSVPAVPADAAFDMVARSGCRTAEVTVGATGQASAADVARIRAVRAAVGADGAVRCAAHGRWDVDTAVRSIDRLAEAAGGLQFVEQPCRTSEETATVRREVTVPIAADAALLGAAGRPPSGWADAVDIAVLASGPLGGVRRALRVAEACGLPCTVSSSGETSVGLAAGVALAGVLRELPFACALGTGLLRDGDVVAGRTLIPVDGHLPVAPMPPSPATDLLDRFALTDPDRLAWWRRRVHRTVRGTSPA